MSRTPKLKQPHKTTRRSKVNNKAKERKQSPGVRGNNQGANERHPSKLTKTRQWNAQGWNQPEQKRTMQPSGRKRWQGKRNTGRKTQGNSEAITSFSSPGSAVSAGGTAGSAATWLSSGWGSGSGGKTGSAITGKNGACWPKQGTEGWWRWPRRKVHKACSHGNLIKLRDFAQRSQILC